MKKILLMLMGTVIVLPSVFSATWHVSPDGNDANSGATWALAKRTIQAGVDAASNGDIVLVTNGNYVLTAQINMGKSITVKSVNGALSTILDGNYPNTVNRCASVNASSILDGFTITKGRFPYGGGVCIEVGGGTVRNCIIYGNSADNGGGVDIWSGAGLMENCTIIGNNSGVRNQAGLVQNCIICSNVSYNTSGGGTFDHCYISNPFFVDYASSNYLLQATSPCINAGTNQNWMLTGIDCCGNPRISHEIVDIGAHEYDGHRTWHVSPDGNNANSGATWALAKKTIQAGVDAASAGDVVWVTNGVYSTGGRVQSGCNLLTRVLATNGVIIRSVNGPAQTIIDGGGASYGSTDSARPVLVDSGSRLEGFTLIGGSTRADGVWPNDQTGGGVFVDRQSVVSNCIIKQCTAHEGGGIYMYNRGTGVVTHCQIISNSANRGGGVRFSDAVGSYVQNCVLQYNTAVIEGGGVQIYHIGKIRNCLITDNACTNDGGGVHIDWGSKGAYVENCTIARNRAPIGGGIGYIINGATVKNTIIWGNTDANWDGSSYEYSCLTPAASGTGNFASDPLFVNSAAGNFRLAAGSPCINAGFNQDWMLAATDLDGNNRIITNVVDIGTYEYNGPITVPLSPENIQVTDGTYMDKVRITWSASSSATGYQIFRYTSNNSASADQIGTAISTTYDDTGAVTDTTYYYWVKATNSTGASEFSAYDTGWRAQTIAVPSVPAGVSASDGTYTDKVLITWEAASSATGYQIFRHTIYNSASADQIGTTTSTTYNDTGAVAGPTYYYWVKATNSAGTSGFSSHDTGWRAQSSVAPSVPTGVSASDGIYTNKVILDWNTVVDATGYQIFRHTSSNSTSADQIGTTDSNTYNDISAIIDTTYYYWVKATNSAGASPFSSYDTGYRTPSASTLSAPTNVSASDGTYTNQVRVTWSAVSGAGNYDVWRNTLSSTNGASLIVDTVATTYDDTNVTSNVSYYYWIRAKNPIVTSAFSLPNSGYASMGNTSCSADLSVLGFMFLPTVMSVGDHPGAVSVQLINYGPYDLISPNTRVAFNLYLSANTVFGDADDVWMGSYSCDKILGTSSYTTLVVPSSGREELTVPPGLASGNYYVFIRVQHESPSILMDPDLSNNYVMRGGAISITGSSSMGYHLFNDYDMDGKSDVALYKESTGEWLILLSGSGYSPSGFILGGSGFKPILADYDGDGKSDPAVCCKGTGEWKVMMSGNGYQITPFIFGENGCVPVTMDYDGDGKADPTVYRESAGTWEIMCSAKNYIATTIGFGGHGRTPVPADYDGDGISDMATYRDSTGDWAIMLSSMDYWTVEFNLGGQGSMPVPADYDGDGKADPAVYKESSGDWSVMMSRFNYLPASGSFGGHGWVPAHADYDGDGKEDIAIYNDGQHMLKVLVSGNDYGLITLEVGGSGYEPVGWPQ